tara:strand:+ start:623 stop:1294 length:672 start_codon:yes stop_codon:yes gene_type:complete
MSIHNSQPAPGLVGQLGANNNNKSNFGYVSLTAQKENPFPMEGILKPLANSNGGDYMGGVIFPFTPTMQISHQASYGTYDATHTIYQPNYYINTPSPTISITANFASNDLQEAAYTAAALHFFKTCTKGDFGQQRRETAGTPPPILKLRAYAKNGLHANSTPVVIRSFNYTMQEDVNYVEGDFGIVPTMLVCSLELSVQIAPSKVRKEFNIDTFSKGKMGGFI